jgi:hypothetical protein
LISTYAGAAEALKLPFPLNLAASAAVLAKGLALVAAIKSFAVPKGFAEGGSFNVKGGMSGVDNAPTMLNLAAGERVDITPAHQANKSNSPTNVFITVPNEMVSRDYLRKMIEGLNDMTRDGYRLNVSTP